jgi:hypothetical protein
MSLEHCLHGSSVAVRILDQEVVLLRLRVGAGGSARGCEFVVASGLPGLTTRFADATAHQRPTPNAQTSFRDRLSIGQACEHMQAVPPRGKIPFGLSRRDGRRRACHLRPAELGEEKGVNVVVNASASTHATMYRSRGFRALWLRRGRPRGSRAAAGEPRPRCWRRARAPGWRTGSARARCPGTACW